MADEPRVYRSSEMAVATYLRMNHFEVQEVYLDPKSRSCYWVFADSAVLQSHLQELQLGKALVDPIAFNRAYSRTKNEMFATTHQSRD